MAGNKMESIYEWRFTTGDPPPDTLPDAPAGIIAASGNSQNTITWDAVPAATSYNIYWSTTSGVTTAIGAKISDITTTSYTHTGLTNGTIYYYRVCAIDNAGNASIGSEVSAMPRVGFALSGTMTNARYIHQATRLADGRVLVTGGVGISGAMDFAETYDSSTGTFSQTGNMNMPRFSHTATLLSNGKVLIAGGRNNTGVNNASSYLSSAELYDPVTGT